MTMHLSLSTLATLMLAFAAPGAAAPVAPRPDLADIAQGSYAGDVISDARGSSRSDVRIMVAKVAPGQVEVTSDYARLPRFRVRLTRAMQTIQNQGGDIVFLLDLARTPHRLDISVDDASWSGSRQ